MRYVIVVEPVYARIEAGSKKLVKKLLSVVDPRSLTSDSARMKLWDGLFRWYDATESENFPAGLAFRLAKRLRKRGHEVVLRFDPPRPEIPPIEAGYLVGIDLRDYQIEGVNIALKKRRGILAHATNAGKTAALAAILGAALRAMEGQRALVVVPNQHLLHQTSKKLQELIGPDLKVSRLGDGHRTITGDIVVATQNTLLQALPAAAKPDGKGRMLITRKHDPLLRQLCTEVAVIAVDEAHHVSAQTYHDLLKLCTNAVIRLGFTGSEDIAARRELAVEKREADSVKARMHRFRLEAFLGPVLHEVRNKVLIARGVSARPRVFIVVDRRAFGRVVLTPHATYEEVNGKRVKKPVVDAYGQVFRAALVEDKTFLKTVRRTARVLIAQGKAPFVFSHSVEQLRALRRAFERCASPVPCRMLYGNDSTAKRDAVLKRYRREGNFALLTSSIFDEGADVPEIRSIVLAGARKSVRELLQRMGRGLRAKADDNTITIIDFRPVNAEMLAEHSEEREAIFNDEGIKVRHIADLDSLSGMNL